MTTKISGMHIGIAVVLGLAIGMVRSDNLAVEPELNTRELFAKRDNSEPASAAKHSSSSLNYNEPCYLANGYPVYQPYQRPGNLDSSYGQEQSSKLPSSSCNNQYPRYHDDLGGVEGIVDPYGVSGPSNVGAPSVYSNADSKVGGVGRYNGAGGYGNPVEYGNVAGFGKPGGLRVGDIGEYGGPYGDVWKSSPGSYLSALGQFSPHINNAGVPQVIKERYDSAP